MHQRFMSQHWAQQKQITL